MKIAGAVVFLLGSFQLSLTETATNAHAAKSCVKLVVPDCDEEPIIVRGHITTMTGTPISGASVKLKQGGVVKYQTTTDGSGEYCIGGVTEGNYVFHASASGYITKTFDLPVTAEVSRTDSLVAQ